MSAPQAQQGAAEAWFNNLVVTGLQQLYSLSLQGCPAAEVLPLTAVSWVEALWRARPWVEALDAARLAVAFTALAAAAERWPAPRQLLHHLVARPAPAAALPEPRPQRSADAALLMMAARCRLVAHMRNPVRPAHQQVTSDPDLGGEGELGGAPTYAKLDDADAQANDAKAQQTGSDLK